MSDKDVRAGVQQAKIGQNGMSILSVEALIIALIFGINEQSWGVGIFVFLGMFILFAAMAASEKLGNALAAVIGAAWGFAAFWLALSMQATPATAWGVAIVAGLVGLGGHSAGFQHLRDIRKAKG